MRYTRAIFLAGLCSCLLSGCDFLDLFTGGGAPAKGGGGLTSSPAPTIEKGAAVPPGAPSSPTLGPAAGQLKDAVGPATPGSGLTDPGRMTFDGARGPAALPGAASPVYAGGGPRVKVSLVNAPAAPNSLKINDVPSPGGNGALPGSPAAAIDKKGAVPGAPVSPGALGQVAGNQPVVVPPQPGPGPNPRVLFIGDSHSAGDFGKTLHAVLTANHPEADVETYASGGSSSWWYLPGYRSVTSKYNFFSGPYKGRSAPKLAEVLKPETKVVIVALGSNQIDWSALGRIHLAAGRDKGLEKARTCVGGKQNVRALAKMIYDNNSRCFWIGPPDMRGPKGDNIEPEVMTEALKAMDQLLSESTSGYCRFVPTDTKTHYPGGDGVHYPPKPAQEWARLVAPELAFTLP